MIQNLLARLRELLGIYESDTEWGDSASVESRPLLLPLLSGILGLLLGLFIGWVVWPVEWQNIRLSHLDPDARAAYIAAVADAYVSTGESSEGAELADRRLSGMVLEDYGLALSYFDNELVNYPYTQNDQNIRRDNLTRLAYRLNIDPAQAKAQVDASMITTDNSNIVIDPTINTTESESLQGDAQVVDGAQATGGGFNFGRLLQLGLVCLTALAMILGGMYLIRYWLRERGTAPDGVAGATSADSIGPYRDRAKTSPSAQIDDELDDDGEFDDFYEEEEDNRYIGSYEPDENWQTTVDEANPTSNPYRPPAQSAVAPFEPEAGTAQSPAYRPNAGGASAEQAAFQRPAGPPQRSSAPQQASLPRSAAPMPTAAAAAAQPPAPKQPIQQPNRQPAQQAVPTNRLERTSASNQLSGQVLTQFTARYQRGTLQYEQQRNIVAPSGMERGSADGLQIGEYGMGTNMKSGVLQNDPENVIALDVWLFDKTDQQGPRNQTRVLISEYVIDNDLAEAVMRDGTSSMDPIVPQRGDEFEIRGTSLLLVCKVIEAVYEKDDEMKGVFDSIAVDMTVMHL